MRKYENILNNSDEFTDVKLTPAEGIAAIALISLLADRPDAEIPADDLIDIFTAFETFDDYTEEDLLAMITKLTEIIDQEGLGALFNAADDVEVISDDLVPDAYAMAVATLIDDETLAIPPAKSTFMQELQVALDVDNDEATAIFDDVVATLQGVDVSEESTTV
jgi:hypothetical protein